MLDKIGFLRSCARAKKVCVFFAVFFAVLATMSGVVTTGINDKTPAVEIADNIAVPAIIQEEPVTQTVVVLNDNRTQVPLPEDFDTEKNEISDMEKPAEILTEQMDELTPPTGKKELEVRTMELAEEENGSTGEAAKADGFVYIDSIPMHYELQRFTYEKCVERGLEYELVLAIMWRESRFKTDAVNVNADGTRDNGIMQINDVNRGWLYEKYGIDDLMDPYQNINAGTAMLSLFANKYGTHGAMLAYQYGEGGMTRRLGEGQTTSHAIEMAYQQRDYYRQLV